jgi:ElaB/YqjD/DUF883 family membrane-anchored ribosome-binding protein
MTEYRGQQDILHTQPESGDDNRSQVQEQTREYAERAKETAQEYGQKAQESAESGKNQAAGGMERAAAMVRDRTATTDGPAAEAGTKVAEGMESAAAYLKEHSTSDILSDIEKYAKEHPGQALAGAVFTGFVLGRILR